MGELKRLKRDAAIRAKQSDYLRKQKEEEEAKKQQLEHLKQEFEMQEQMRVEERLRLLQKQAEARAQKKAEHDKLVARRNQAMEKKNAKWKETTNAKIQKILDDAAEEDMRLAEAQELARRRRTEHDEAKLRAKLEAQGKQYYFDNLREQAHMAKESRRRQKELQRVDSLKAEAHQELQSFIQNPFPVPLKQVLAGRMRPVPTVTELLATHKDQREMLKELEAQDIPMRALLRNQSLFQYVRDVQLEAEANSVRPPEPAGMSKGRSKPDRGSFTKKNFRGTH